MLATPRPFIEFVFLRAQRWDYFVFFLIGLAPILIAKFIGAEKSGGGFTGYHDADNYNWLMWPVALPLGVFLVRSMWRRVLGQDDSEPSPILTNVQDESQRSKAQESLLDSVGSKPAILSLLAVAVVLNGLDLWEDPGQYYWQDLQGVEHDLIRQKLDADAKDWSAIFLDDTSGAKRPTAPTNFTLVLSAYTSQFLATFYALSLVLLFAIHNCCFLRLVYQRRWASGGKVRPIVLDLRDPLKNLGLRRANLTFSYQVFFTFIVGGFLLASRYANIKTDPLASLDGEPDKLAVVRLLWDAFWNGEFAPDLGQAIILVCWLALFAVTMIPILVKLLPLLPRPLAYRDPVRYLREFMPDGSWKADGKWDRAWGEDPSREQLEVITKEVAGAFAKQNFWPNGPESQARFVFFAAFFMLFLMLLPIVPSRDFRVALTLVAVGALCVVMTGLVFWAIRSSLSIIVGPELVKEQKKDDD